MKTDTYIVTLESGHYEWTREDEIHSYKAAIAAGIKEAERCGKDIFYLVRCSQWWPKINGMADYLIDEIDEQLRDDIVDYGTLDALRADEIEELDNALDKLIRQWLIRNNRIPNGVYFDDEIIYKVVNGKAVKLGKAI
ncbi:hypothetical protein QP561_06965 [Veillonella nakazawae]|nr:hypothetical protein [Veillonella nakazawae]MDK7739987.1 hypothetical protein [Veillonella nakazawae]